MKAGAIKKREAVSPSKTNKRDQAEKLRNLLRGEEPIMKMRMPKQLELGLTHICSYSRHAQPVKSVFYNPNTNTYVSYNQKGMHVWMSETQELLYSVNFQLAANCKEVSFLLYSTRFHLYFAFGTDFKLLVLNEHLHVIRELPIKNRLIQFACFYEEQSQIITAGIDGCFINNMKIESKYSPKQAIMLDPDGRNIDLELVRVCQLPCMDEWVKGLKIDTVNNLIIAWDQLCVCFYQLKDFIDIKQGTLIRKYNELFIKENFITDLLIFNDYKTFITGTQYGQLIAWKWGGDDKQLVHQFYGHIKTITEIVAHPSKRNLFISASLDCTIKVWCLDKLVELYNFTLDLNELSSKGLTSGGLTPAPCGGGGGQGKQEAVVDQSLGVKLLSESVFAVIQGNGIELGRISHTAQAFFNTKSSIAKIGHCFTHFDDHCTKYPYAIFVTFDDNSVVVLNPKTGQIISTIYPPPTATSIHLVAYSLHKQRVFILLKTGALCIYRILDKETAVLELMQYPNQLKDSSGKAISQQITTMTIASTVPPKFDCELFNDASKYRIKELLVRYMAEKLALRDVHESYLVFGMSKGSIIFIQVDNLDQIHSRFSIHRQGIKLIKELPKQGRFMTICEELILNIWGFQEERAIVYQSVPLYREVISIQILSQNVPPPPERNQQFSIFSALGQIGNLKRSETGISSNHQISFQPSNISILKSQTSMESNESSATLVLGFIGGDTELMQWIDNDKKLYRIQTEKISEHDDILLSLDALEEKSMILTACSDGLVKIWNSKKEMLREIKFHDQITQALFLNNNADVLVAHGGQLSVIYAVDYQPFETPLPAREAVQQFITEKRDIASDNLFLQLKKQEDEVKNQTGTFFSNQSETPKRNQSVGKADADNESKDIALEISSIKLKDDGSKGVTPQQKKHGARQMTKQQVEHIFDENMYRQVLEEAMDEQNKRVATKKLQSEKKVNKEKVRPSISVDQTVAETPLIGTQAPITHNETQPRLSVTTQNSPLKFGEKKNKRFIQSMDFGKNNVGSFMPKTGSTMTGGRLGSMGSGVNLEDDKIYSSNIDVISLRCASIKAPTKTIINPEKQVPKQPITRRNITLSKISNNILLHNAPTDFQNFSDLMIDSAHPSIARIASGAGMFGASNMSSYSNLRTPSGLGKIAVGHTLLDKKKALRLHSKDLLLNSTSMTGDFIAMSKSHGKQHKLKLKSSKLNMSTNFGTSQAHYHQLSLGMPTLVNINNNYQQLPHTVHAHQRPHHQLISGGTNQQLTNSSSTYAPLHQSIQQPIKPGSSGTNVNRFQAGLYGALGEGRGHSSTRVILSTNQYSEKYLQHNSGGL